MEQVYGTYGTYTSSELYTRSVKSAAGSDLQLQKAPGVWPVFSESLWVWMHLFCTEFNSTKKIRFHGQRNRETVNLFFYINPPILAILLKIIPSVLSIIKILEIILRRILTVAANCRKLFEKSDIQCFISKPRLLERKGKKKKKKDGLRILTFFWLYLCNVFCVIPQTRKLELKSASSVLLKKQMNKRFHNFLSDLYQKSIWCLVLFFFFSFWISVRIISVKLYVSFRWHILFMLYIHLTLLLSFAWPVLSSAGMKNQFYLGIFTTLQKLSILYIVLIVLEMQRSLKIPVFIRGM